MNQRVIIPLNGSAEVLQLIEEPCQEIKDNEVRIKVIASGIAFADIMMRKGQYPGAPAFPFTPGHEVVGVIHSVGLKVNTMKKGQLVAAFCKYGGYTRFINLPANQVTPVPEGVDPYHAAAILLNYVTAYQLLHRYAQVKEGDTLLIHGASGGVGTALLQLCRGLNVEVFGSASLKNQSIVTSYGAKFIDYQHEDFVERIQKETTNGVDIVLDGIGGYHWERSYQTLKPEGKFIGYGLTYASQNNVSLEEHQFMRTEWEQLSNTNRTSSGHKGTFYSISKVDPLTIQEDLNFLFQMLLCKKIEPKISYKIPLSQVIMAHQLFEKGTDGKILLINQE